MPRSQFPDEPATTAAAVELHDSYFPGYYLEVYLLFSRPARALLADQAIKLGVSASLCRAAAPPQVLTGLGMLPSAPALAPPPPPDYLAVQLDGRVVGHVRSGGPAAALVARLRAIKAATLQVRVWGAGRWDGGVRGGART